ncbi:MAG: J domain-containing protein [Nostoc sp. DedQUE12a]|nr:J domain-containing protein [Nostoc sp. DedQUE12a]
MAYEFYQLLELSPQATPSEIKRSYFRLVRKYSPEKDPERFKSIREAYETLSDLKAKENYDSLQQHGEQISKLVNEAEKKMSDEDWEAAIPIFKKVLVILPGENAARNQLGICFARLQDWDNALKVYRKLTKDGSDVPLYWLNYGAMFKEYAGSLDNDDTRRSSLYQQAREQFKKAIDLEPYNSEPYVEISRTYTDEDEYTKALLWAERAIGADGKTDLHDFETLFYMCVIHLRSGEFKKIQSVAERIISLLPEDDEDTRKYVAARFYNFGIEIAEIGFANSNITLLDAARFFLKAAKTFDPSDKDIKQHKGILDNLIQAYELYDSFKEDSQLSPGFSRLGAFSLSSAINHEIDNRDEVFDDILNEIFSVQSTLIITSVRRIKSYYFPIYQLNDSLFDKIQEVAQESLSKNQSQSTKKKGCFLTTACISYAGLPDDCFELQTLRDFRDNYLASTPEGQALIKQYYAEAPIIVDLINSDQQSELILKDVLETVRACVNYICCQRPDDALTCYMRMYQRLRIKYLENN